MHGFGLIPFPGTSRPLGCSSIFYLQVRACRYRGGLWLPRRRLRRGAAGVPGLGRMVQRMQTVWDPTLTDPLEQLRLVVRTFLIWSAEQPELVALMDIEARQDTERLAYIYTTYIAPALAPLDRLLDHLVAEGKIRKVPLRTFHFLLAHGAAAPFTLVPLAQHFDHRSPLRPRAVREHADLVADLMIEGIRL